jgi:NAD(P)-dependent dehydrogenase (short-subunit alcohol dehydrogenase family)
MTRLLVTGAGGQLGSAIVAALAARGATVVASDLRAADGVIAADVTRDTDVARLVRAAAPLDGCVNAFGAEGPVGPLEELDLDEVRALLELNVIAVLRVLRALVPHLRERGGGRVVNLASGAGLAGTALMAPYSASKHAVVGLCRTAARELAADGIAVNALCPGCVDSPMMTRIETAVGGSFADAVPAGRYASAAEIADVAAYLALEAPLYLTGAAIVVDGALRA